MAPPKDADAVREGARGPGIAKARTPLLTTATHVRTSDAVWREAFARADVVSEGAVRDEAEGPVWYGSTSLIVTLDPSLAAPYELYAVAERDLHARLRATRIARAEAQVRAPASLGKTQCEIRFLAHPRGLRVDVEVEAALIVRPKRSASSGSPESP